jgi:hypothetical protein
MHDLALGCSIVTGNLGGVRRGFVGSRLGYCFTRGGLRPTHLLGRLGALPSLRNRKRATADLRVSEFNVKDPANRLDLDCGCN